MLIPDGQTFDGIFAKGASCFGLCRVGSDEGDCKIEPCFALQNVPNATKYAVHFPKCPEPIAINQRQVLSLLEQLFVCHDDLTPAWEAPDHDIFATKVKLDSQPTREIYFRSCSGITLALLDLAQAGRVNGSPPTCQTSRGIHELL